MAIEEKYTAIGSYVEVFDSSGLRKGFHQVGSGDYLGCQFSLSEEGCRSAILDFAKFVDIEKRDIIKIKVFNSSQYFFTGVVRNVPIQGSTKQDYSYSAFGLPDYLNRLNTQSLSYNATTIKTVVLDILNNIIIDKSPITKNLAKIDALNIAINSITFHYISVKAAMDQLQKIANSDGNDYIYGVDVDGDFYFKARDTSTIATLVVGKLGDYGIEEYAPKDDVKTVSRLLVLRNDGTLYGIYTSTEDIDINEIKLTGPNISDADLDNWAQGQLNILEVETRQATIEWQIKNRDPFLIIADSYIRILSSTNPAETNFINVLFYGQGAYGSGPYGGYKYEGYELDDVLKIKQVEYTINDSQAYMQLRLGSLPVALDSEILKVNKKIEDLKISLVR